MTVTIDLPPEAEAKLREQAEKQGTKLEDFLSDLAKNWASHVALTPNDNGRVDHRTPEQKVADWQAFVASHDHITAIADDSRESIYEGCGE